MEGGRKISWFWLVRFFHVVCSPKQSKSTEISQLIFCQWRKKSEWRNNRKAEQKGTLCRNFKSVLRKCETCADHDDNVSNFRSTSLPLSVVTNTETFLWNGGIFSVRRLWRLLVLYISKTCCAVQFTQCIHFGKKIRNTLQVLKCGAKEEYRRSVGAIVCNMRNCYTESRIKGITYIQ